MKNTKKANKGSKFFLIPGVVVTAAVIITVSILALNKNDSLPPEGDTGINTASEKAGSESPVEDLVINANDVSEKAKFYKVNVDGTELEVLAVKAPDGSIRTAFNTCQICYSSGRGYYEQEGDDLVCQNCGNRFSSGDVERTRGGCNPVPIGSENKTVAGDTISISGKFLSESKNIFANWK